MRRARHKLQVSTFPFLAVLLGAMGALILLLLVMDRRSKIVARTKAVEAHANQIAARTMERDRDVKDEEARQADWERKRRELHELLVEQDNELSQERARLASKLDGLSQDWQKENKALADLEKSLLEERARLDVKGQLLSQMRAGIARTAKLDDASKSEVEKLAGELAELERVLQEAKTLKTQETETYSLVPYRGKLGETRRPVYVECTANGLMFHPDLMRLDNAAFGIQAFRTEVQRRGVELVREKLEPERPSRPPVAKVATNPYVLFLVRPDGLDSYYQATTALRGFDLDFGYEFIDSQWALDFTQGRQAGDRTPPLAEGPSKRYVSTGLQPAGTQSRAQGMGPPIPPGVAAYAGTGGSPRLGSLAGENANGPINTDSPGATPAIGPSSSRAGTALRPSQSLNKGAAVSGAGGPDYRATLEGPGNGPRSAADNGFQPQAPGAAIVSNQTGTQGNRPGNAGQTLPFSRSGSSSTGNTGHPGFSNVNGGEMNPGGAQPKPVEGDSQDVAWRGSQKPTSQRFAATDGPAKDGDAPHNSEQTPGSGEQAGDAVSVDPLARLGLNVPFADTRPGPKKPAPAPSVGRLLANRDYILTMECFGDVVALYPSSQVFAVTNGVNQKQTDEALVQAVLQLIARRQATVRAGEAPYRPMLRFQVHPDALRTYFHVYPLFENLRVPMARENLAS